MFSREIVVMFARLIKSQIEIEERSQARLHGLPWKLSFIPHSECVEYGEIFMETRTRVPTYASALCLAARLTLNFVAPSLWLTHLRAVRYASLYRLLLRTSGLGCVPIIPDTWISLISSAKYFKTFSYDFSMIF